ncbi:cupin-like domain-containing protein [Psychroserpens luteus]|uniref:Cupin-like domain-containing protein n=1 Tax=Psychroserpens luteus TaxID=1434066 RepID=A0ABW5ZYR9_9FLAO|nr:cupin-like domain-containing protein [Psychroserpens luteus]
MKPTINISKIDRCSGLSNKEFYNTYVKNSLPVVISDIAEWTTSEKFTTEYFKANYSHLTRTIDGKTYSLSEIIDLCESSTPENKAPYPNIYDLHKDFPEYLEDIPLINYGKSNRLSSWMLPNSIANQTNQRQLFFGGKGCSFPTLHIDYHWVHTQLTQIIGEKDFILYPPSQTPYLYPDKINHNLSQVNIINPDSDKFPLFKNAEPLKITLKPGDTMFIPSGWWHTTYIHNFNLTYAIDHVNSFNWNRFMDENYLVAQKHHPNLAWLVKVYKVIMGKIFNINEKLIQLN